jgi:hypothetical protein
METVLGWKDRFRRFSTPQEEGSGCAAVAKGQGERSFAQF